MACTPLPAWSLARVPTASDNLLGRAGVTLTVECGDFGSKPYGVLASVCDCTPPDLSDIKVLMWRGSFVVRASVLLQSTRGQDCHLCSMLYGIGCVCAPNDHMLYKSRTSTFEI